MASIINTIIQKRAFELIRDRIGLILAEELVSQASLNSDSNLAAKVYVERFIPFTKPDLPALNVSLATGDYDNMTSIKSDGTYQFYVDIYTNSTAKGTNSGDAAASIKLQRLAGVCHAILSDSAYMTLAFAPPFIEHTEVKSINIGTPQSVNEATNIVMARLTFIVRVPEKTRSIIPSDIAGYTTKMVLGLTDKGYLFGGDAFLPPVTPICAPVEIRKDGVFEQFVDSGGVFDYSNVCADATVNVNGDSFATIPSGDTLPITVEYETSLVNPIQSISGSSIIITDPIVVPTNRIYLRPSPTGEIYDPLDPTNYPNGCDSWRVVTGQDISTQPSSGMIMYLDRSDVSKTVPDNIFGHKFRVTGLTGGYFNADTGNYHNSDSSVSDRATAFSSDYFIDHHTGLGGKITANGSNVTWQAALTEIDALSFAGFDDYFLPNLNELLSIVNFGYLAPLAQSTFPNALPPFDMTTNGTKWTGTTYKQVIDRAWVIQPNGDTAQNLKSGVTRYMAFRYHFNNL